MTRRLIFVFTVFISLTGFTLADSADYAPGQVLVRFAEQDGRVMNTAAKRATLDSVIQGCTVRKEYHIVPGLTLVQLPTGTSVSDAVKSLTAASGIRYAEPNYRRRIALIPNDSMFDALWGMHNTGQTGGTFDADIDAPEAWDIHTGSRNVIAAVIDTGIDYDHVDLAANLWINEAEFNGSPDVDDDDNGYVDDIYGIDAVNDDGDPMDDAGHGTHVSGTIGAVGNNSEGVAGVCWQVSLMALKCLDSDGGGYVADEVECIQYAIDMGARVMNASFGGYGFSEAEYNVIVAAEEAGLLLCASAGNNGWDNDDSGNLHSYPSDYDLDNIISVMSTDYNDEVSYFSNYGLISVDVAAPGSDILSCLWDEEDNSSGYVPMQGTSMACPHVTGACALYLSVAPGATYMQVKQGILQAADPLPSLAGLSVTGARLNIFNALNALGVNEPPYPDPAEWEIEPGASGLHTIGMKAVVAQDPSGVEYSFECTTDNNFDSGWQDSSIYTRDDFEEGTEYSFKVMARDKSDEQLETEWSVIKSATTASPVDDLPPWPNPARWKAKPRQVGPLEMIAMEAMAGFDESGVEYYFDCDNDAFDRDWDDSPVYFISSGLVMGNTYTFTVTTRDKVSPVPNTGDPSDPPVSVTLKVPPQVLEVPFPYATIQDAVDAAADNNGDNIIVHPGTYTGTGNVDIDFKGKVITLRSEDPDNPDIVASTIINCGGGPTGYGTYLSHRAFEFDDKEMRDSIVAGFTITNGYIREGGAEISWAQNIPDGEAGGAGVAAFGGAIFCEKSSPTIRNCIISNCVADGSGGNGGPGDGSTDPNDGFIGGDGGDAAGAYGGAIYCDAKSSPLIENCVISNCRAVADGGDGGDGEIGEPDNGAGGAGGNADPNAYGGAIYCDGGSGAVIANCTISLCDALTPLSGVSGTGETTGLSGSGIGVGRGGAVYFGKDAGSKIINSVISGNTAGDDGGALYYYGDCDTELANSRFQGNTAAGNGGAIYFGKDNGPTGLFDCVISGNYAGGNGGAVYYIDTKDMSDPNNWLSIVNCDIENNSTYVNHTSTTSGGVGGAVYVGDSNAALGAISATVQIIDSRINANESEYGGAVCAVSTDLRAYKCTLNGNIAEYGGAVFTHNSTTDIDTCVLNHNLVENAGGILNYASGGAVYFHDSASVLINSVVSANHAEGFGGAMYFTGFDTSGGPQKIINCLITANTAGIGGAGLSANVSAYPLIDNCTIADNYVVSDVDVMGAGGGVNCYDAFVEIKRSILWGNDALYGRQIAVGDPVEIYNPFSTVLVTYSDIQGGQADVFVGQGGGPLLVYDDVTNITDDPLFASTVVSDDPADLTYYLSAVEAGQLLDSPCIGRGPDDVAELATLLNLVPTTRTNHEPYTGDVDLGFHYDASQSTNIYMLFIEIVRGGDTDVAEPYPSGTTHFVPQGTTVQLEVILDPEYYLKSWTGSDDDTSTSLVNTVTVNGHKTVTIECDSIKPSLYTDVSSNNGDIYVTLRDGTETTDSHTMHTLDTVVPLRAAPDDPEERVKWTGTDDDTITGLYNTVTMAESKDVSARFYTPRILHVGAEGEYTDVQRAIDDADDDDIVVIHPGEWWTNTPVNGWVIEGKAITLTSTEPDNPAIVAQTILRDRIQIEDVGPDTIINGLTILEVHYFGVDGIDGQETGDDGSNGSETFGAGLRIGYYNRLARRYPGLFPELPASPTILNCVFRGCSNIGGNGGNGNGGSEDVPGGDGGWGGRAGGGAIFVGPLCNPTFKNCQFLDNFVDGGNGGNGGDAAPDNFGGVGGSWDNIPPWPGWTYGPYEPYWKYSGYGGALFCDVESFALFEDCIFSGNHTEGSLSGVNGVFMRYDVGPDRVYNIENFGGAIYCEANSNVKFTGCTITNNYADTSVEPFNDDPYVSYGGAIGFGEGANVRFEDCLFQNNAACVGGSLYWEGSYATIADCNVVSSLAYQGGGAYFVGSETNISRCIFEGNEADFDFAQGGGVFCFDSNSVFVDSRINDNRATGSGGGLYLSGNDSVQIRNCLITNNSAGVSGGGITSSWYSNTSIVNSTIADNIAERILPTQEEVIGGGLLCSFNSSVDVIDSIIWGNDSDTAGPQIAVSGTDPYNPLPATVEVSYSDVQGGKSEIFIDVGQNDPLWIGNINEDPLFETGLLGDYYISQVQAGQSEDSPCVDAGSKDVRAAGMDTYLTRTDHQLDRSVVDMGFHRRFAVVPDMCRVADMERDGIIDLPDLLILAEYWLNLGCNEEDGSDFGWCHAADIDKNQGVDFYDYAFLTYCWKIEDTKPPQPNPMEWKDPPYPDGVGAISMIAETATDAWWRNEENYTYIQYFFQCSDNAFDSDWVDEPEYTAAGLVNGQQYSFRVQARDGRRREGPLDENRTEFSEWAFATAGAETIPPEPDPSLWATLEHDGIIGIPEPSGPGSIKMAAYTATDPSGPVEYYFRYTEPDGVTPGQGDGHDSDWQLSNVYEDTGLTIDQFYTYVVRTRDAWGNETQESFPVIVLLDEWDDIFPEPDPPMWEILPTRYSHSSGWWHYMSVQPATDDSGVEYYFDCIEDNDYDSGWQSVDGVGPEGLLTPPNVYWVYVGGEFLFFHYRVQVRDLSPNQNTTGWSSTEQVPPIY